MKKVDEKFLIQGSGHGFYLTPKQLTEILGCSDRHVRNIIHGIREQIQKGRYSRYALLDSGDIRVNIYAYYDYDKYRRLLEDKNASKVSPCIDHIIPIARGGHPSDIDNMQLAHWTCNRQKSDKLIRQRDTAGEEEVISNRMLPHSVNWAEYRSGISVRNDGPH